MRSPATASTSAPRVGRRRGARKGDLKEAAILDTAWQLLAKKPLSAITVQDLTAGAGISRSTFYFYFDSKEAAVLALAERVGRDVAGRAVAPFFRSDAPAEVTVRDGIASYLQLWRDHGAVIRAMHYFAENDEALVAFLHNLEDDLLDHMAVGIEDQRSSGAALPGPPARDLVNALAGMLWRAGYLLSSGSPTAAEQEQLIDTLTTICLRSLYGTSEA